MTQLSFFDSVPTVAKRKSQQQENIERVSQRIAGAIARFYMARIFVNPQFHADDLRRYVMSVASVAPSSADRILRDMRRKHLLNYRVVSRAESLYEFLP